MVVVVVVVAAAVVVALVVMIIVIIVIVIVMVTGIRTVIVKVIVTVLIIVIVIVKEMISNGHRIRVESGVEPVGGAECWHGSYSQRECNKKLGALQDSLWSIAEASCRRIRAAVGSARMFNRFSSSPASCKLRASAVLLRAAAAKESCMDSGELAELDCELAHPGHGGTATKRSGEQPACSSAPPLHKGSNRCRPRPRTQGGTSLRRPASRAAALAEAEPDEAGSSSSTLLALSPNLSC